MNDIDMDTTAWTDDAADCETSEDDASDVVSIGLDDEEDMKAELKDLLDEFTSNGSFAAFHTYQSYVNPGLDIEGFGPVGLPLTPTDAESIARFCKQSPFGKGDKTLVDTSVRRSWELDTTQFQCRNPAWKSYLAELEKKAKDDLGVAWGGRADGYKLLLYEEGAFFKAHKDSEKVPGMFGTLVVCLPSQHMGGDVHLVHGKKKRTMETAPGSSFDLSTLAWYSDVSHEVRPVTSGYRLVLTYNLVHEHQQIYYSASSIDDRQDQLEVQLKRWNTRSRYRYNLIYPLQHQYSEASLSLHNLKGEDAEKGKLLARLCARNGLACFLGRLTRREQDEFDSDDGDELDSFYLSHIVHLSGCRTRWRANDVGEDDILADVEVLYGKGRPPDSEDDGEFMGNESTPSTYRYHDSVIIITRESTETRDLSLRDNTTPESLSMYFELLLNDHIEGSNQSTSTLILRSFDALMDAALQGILGHSGKYEFGSAGHRYEQLFTRMADYCIDHESLNSVRKVFTSVHRAFNGIMRSNTYWTSRPNFVRLLATYMGRERAENPANNADVWGRWLSTTRPNPPTFDYADRTRLLSKFLRPHLHESDLPSFDNWLHNSLKSILSSVMSYSKADVAALLNLVSTLPEDLYVEIILPILVRHPDRAGAIDFLWQLPLTRDPLVPKSVIVRIYQAILGAKPPLVKLTPIELLGHTYPDPEVRSSYFLDILKQTLHYGLHAEAERILISGLPSLPDSQSDFWNNWKNVMTFLDQLIEVCSKFRMSRTINAAPGCIIPMLRSTTDAVASRRPEKPSNWTRIRTAHQCATPVCYEVDDFIRSPNLIEKKFKYAQSMRTHIEKRLCGGDYEFFTETGSIPHTLVVRKTLDLFNRERAKWQEEAKELRAHLDSFCEEPAKTVFGEMATSLADIKRLVDLPTAPDVRLLKPVPTLTQNIRLTGPSAGQKRKAEFVDLT